MTVLGQATGESTSPAPTDAAARLARPRTPDRHHDEVAVDVKEIVAEVGRNP
jgi:hypothetical protein